jgi:Tol biopolymer transport system component/tRNA A-37 threonylcarbamoyl transferase component Bud32
VPFPAGTRLGPYEIIAPLGAGGMGEVYRARDMRLDRTVAIKVLTGALAADSESRLRFEQEARAIAALNDPHICTIHDVGRHGELDYLVLEYLDGETLADRLQRSPALTVDEAIAIAIQIGDALGRAHREGIVHRDLKPGNVMLVRRGGPPLAPDVKLLDFGLAARLTVVRPQALDATVGPSMVATRPPTGSAARGFSGTVQYMAPEQLDGEAGDHRSDIFAFGCVLYEMLAGRKAFEGTSPVKVIAAITSSEAPPIPALQSSRPQLDHVMRRCLDKHREQRWQNIDDVTGELRWIRDQPVAAAPVAAQPVRLNRVGRFAVAGALSLATVAMAVAALTRRDRDDASPPAAIHFEVPTAPTDDASMALSPDGTKIAFVANQKRVPVLWIRSLDSLEQRALPGTEHATFPFWSPDGQTLAFFSTDKLKRIDVAGGAPMVIADVTNARGGTWSSEGVILFSYVGGGGLMRVPARGGQVERATQVNTGTGPDHRWPQFLPDGKRFIFTANLGTPETNGIYVGSLDGMTPVRVVAGEAAGRFAMPDRLLTLSQGVLQAYRFDPGSAVVKGEPAVVTQGFTAPAGNIGFTTSNNGVLAYRIGSEQRRQLTWVNRQGAVLGAVGEADIDQLASPELSPDERSVAVVRQRTGDNDIWVIEIARNLARRITDGPPADNHPLWDPDNRHVVFFSRRFGGGGPARQAIAGGKAEPLFARGETGQALSWTPDRRYVLIRRISPQTGADLFAVALSGDKAEMAVAASQFDETEGQISPDGKWLAFASDDSGRVELFVQSFPEGHSRTQVSTAGGSQVRWSRDGKELFYVAPDGTMMAVPVSADGGTLDVKVPTALFQTHLAYGFNVLGNKAQYAVSRDGRFLLNTATESASAPIVVFTDWMTRLAK